jgi:hypothetical protein
MSSTHSHAPPQLPEETCHCLVNQVFAYAGQPALEIQARGSVRAVHSRLLRRKAYLGAASSRQAVEGVRFTLTMQQALFGAIRLDLGSTDSSC